MFSFCFFLSFFLQILPSKFIFFPFFSFSIIYFFLFNLTTTLTSFSLFLNVL
uniref:Uncharacterized protein n=1 Tax=Meloidogyne enterolobii TaxID=390850 RepID=A0A6V7U7M0_MELEN|nr:unnamed protein product [Meloidogyne enterolobii]